MKKQGTQGAFELAEAGRLEEAAEAYVSKLATLAPDHWGTPLAHGEYGWVLTELGRLDEAGEQFAQALDLEESLAAGEVTTGVITARHFLAENLLERSEPALALQALTPCLETTMSAGLEFLVRWSEAQALLQLDRLDDAARAARRALDVAETDERRQAVIQKFEDLVASQ